VRGRERRDALHLHELLPHVAEARRGGRVQGGQVQEEGQHLGARREEEVGRHAEVPGGAQRDAAEEVDHEDGRGRGREEVAEVRVREADDLEGEGLLVLGRQGREAVHFREAVEGDGRVGGRDAREEGARGARVVGRVDDHDGHSEAARAQRLAELDHGHQVPHPRRRVQHHRPSPGGLAACTRIVAHSPMDTLVLAFS
jgi:hypothetical protein